MIIKLGEFRFAPRPRYMIYDEAINVNLNDSSAGGAQTGCTSSGEDGSCGSPIKNREIIFKVRCIGNGDLRAADLSYRAIEAWLNEICASNQQDYFRQIRNEDPLIYPVTSGYIQPLEMELEYGCEGLKTGEVHLFTAEEGGDPEIAMFGYTALRPPA